MMDNGFFSKSIVDEKEELEKIERLKKMIDDKESELRDLQSKMSLSDFSTTQLKAELRRRKNERR